MGKHETPVHIEAERSVLGAMLRSNNAVIAAVEALQPKDFYDPSHREIFDAMLELNLASRKIDLTTLDAELTRRNKLETIGGPSYLVGLASDVPSTANVDAYIKIVLDKSNLRRLLALSESINRATFSGTLCASEIIEKAEATLNEITTSATRKDAGWISGGEAALQAFEAAESTAEPTPTGFAELDEMLCGGLWNPEVTIVGARPGRGKSAFLLAAAKNAARAQKHVCYFSLEMSAVQIGQRLLAGASEVSISKQRYGRKRLDDADWAALGQGLEKLQAESEYLHIYQSYGLTIERLGSIARHAKERGILDLLVVDYIQLMKTVEKTGSDFERLGIVSKGLKQLALSLDIPILTAAQVRRQNVGQERKGSRAPNLDELRGSGDLEQDADNVLLIHSPEDNEDETVKRINAIHVGIIERAQSAGAIPFTVEIAKQRQGQTGRTWCMFKPKYMRFIEDK